MVALVRAGRDRADPAREFEPSSQAIRNWVAQADRRDGRREGKPVAEAGLGAAEREELTRKRRENRPLRLERGILSRAASLERPLSSGGLVCPRDRRDRVRIFPFMSANQACFPICVMARALGMSKPGYDAWRHRPPSLSGDRGNCTGGDMRNCTTSN